MKGLPRPWPYHRSLAFLCLLGLRVVSFNSVEAQAENITTPTQLLALKEGELSSFVAAVEANARNCAVLNGCSSNCSRLSCYEYGTPGDKDYSCLEVANNTFCNVSQNAPMCMQRNFDFTRGFVRRMDQTTDSRVGQTVCTHRSLDEHFKNSTMNDSSHFFRVFFGAVDGTLRIYPGADESCEPSLYDPRIRPWFLQSTYIPKVVTLLIDTGLNMYGTISGTPYETYISKAVTTVLSVLDTLTEDQDYVTIVCFDGDGIKQLNDTMIYNKARMYQSFSDSLNEVAASPSTTNPNSTQTNKAINATISQLDRLTSSNSIPPTYLKVVITLIDGQQYKDIADLNFSATTRNINLFVYSLRTGQAPQCNTVIRASLEEIPDDRLSNPLYALQSYYSFLAKLHIDFKKNQIDYGKLYPDFSGIDARTLTLSKAALGPNGELLGVVGIDFFENKVEQQFPTIQFLAISNEAKSHENGSFDVAVDLSRNVCFNHTEACPGFTSDNVPDFLCARAKSIDINIGCCGSCKGSILPGKKKKTELAPVIGGGVGGGLLALIVFGVIIFFCCRGEERNHRREEKNPIREVGVVSPENGRHGHGEEVVREEVDPDTKIKGIRE